METNIHSFPLSEQQSQALDRVEEDIRSGPVAERVRGYMRANPWTMLGAAAMAGLVATFFCVRRLT